MFPSLTSLIYPSCASVRTLFGTFRRCCMSTVSMVNLGPKSAIFHHKGVLRFLPLLGKVEIDEVCRAYSFSDQPSAGSPLYLRQLHLKGHGEVALVGYEKAEGYTCRNKRTKLAIKKRRKRLGERVSLRYR